MLDVRRLLFPPRALRWALRSSRIRTTSNFGITSPAAPYLLGQREMKVAVRIVLWLGAIALTIIRAILES
jgi:hypothetical protein